ncbi:Brp/Blh family beta-carotene 15,15'-dioxygenase, partial [Psychroserpens sp.]
MSRIFNFSIMLSFFGLWITSMFPGEVEIIFGFLLIFSFGILHGSNDILLIDSLSNQNAKYPFIKVLMSYLFIVGTAVIVFYFLPLLALFLFVIFSAFHFGEQHWDYRTLPLKKDIKSLFYFTYGLLVLQLLFILNPEDVIEIVDSITNYSVTKAALLVSFIINAIAFILFAALIAVKAKRYHTTLISELLYLLVFTVIFKVSTLIWGFTIYFILWHSIPS